MIYERRGCLFQSIRKISKDICFAFVKAFYSRTVIIRVDGGVCSQMQFFVVGQYFVQKGYSVKYDLSWYKECGMDNDGLQVRNFDLLKLFPSLQFVEYKSRPLLQKMKNRMSDRGFENISVPTEIWTNYQTPKYLCKYYHLSLDMYDAFGSYFKLEPKRVLNQESYSLFQQLKTESSVAVHIRRGDLSEYDHIYGTPCSVSYFDKAMQRIASRENHMSIYIFSDGGLWCKENILPVLNRYGDCRVVDINDSGRGYMDLILISSCPYIVTSKGSLGKYGALLSKESNKMVIMNGDSRNSIWAECFRNIVFIDNE